MKKQNRLMIVSAAIALFAGHTSFSEDTKATAGINKATESSTKKLLSKKKMEICTECGKPEAQCACEDNRNKKDNR